ncbi:MULTISPECIES: NACHT domain-containing NTPase [unclassified Pantoea]|uniref:NACHT domain-containing protein n=2 Tax=Pantoea TaxID=53335 RepID=UPI001232C2CC|nr:MULTISPECIES: NACHT domain-containing protein [unclassified Pantoea]KAA5969888.1 NACHT domain-containing protein [Pantoea sp. M_6]KAA5988488.1 NACHT domain-containing protein [Pantoea sp. M_10]
MPINTIIAGATTNAVINGTIKIAIDKLFDKIKSLKWRHGSDNGREIYNKIIGDNDCYLKYIDTCIQKNLFSYTLLDPENKTSISTTYYPIKINKKTVKNKAEIDEYIIDDNYYISNSDITNISGTAGQGKSTILRKLLINQIENGDKIPFFINLSAMKDASIFNEVLSMIDDIGVKCTVQALKSLLSSGRVVIFLDGFDEVKTSKREVILKEIISINEVLKTQVITSSRPETIICDTAGIKQYKIKDLEIGDVIGIIKRAGSHIDISAVEKSLKANKKFSSSLKTPILVVLFVKCFPFMKIIPNDTIEFYKSIFDVMYETHDKTKRFLDRDRIVKNSSRSDSYNLFCAFCFVTLFEEMTSVDEKTMEDKSFEAIELINPNTENTSTYRELAKNLIRDIKDITSLLIKDTDYTYTFPHKSIQEYHAAEFVKMQPLSDDAKKRYCAIVSEKLAITHHMTGFLEFLVKIDKIDSINYILEPYLSLIGVEIRADGFYISDDKLSALMSADLIKSFIVFIPRGMKEIKFDDDFLLMAGEHDKKNGRVVIGPATEMLSVLNCFSRDFDNSYSEKLINLIAISKETLVSLVSKKSQEKVELNKHVEKLPLETKTRMLNIYRGKLNDFYKQYYIKQKETPISKKPSFLERYKNNKNEL